MIFSTKVQNLHVFWLPFKQTMLTSVIFSEEEQGNAVFAIHFAVKGL